MSYPIRKHLTIINKGSKGANNPEFIVIHYVGASGQAMANANYFHSTHRSASAHYFCDPTTIVQVVEDDTPAWHVGDGRRTGQGSINGYVRPGGATNNNSIGVEMCQDTSTGSDAWSWQIHEETLKRVEWLVKELQEKYGIDDDHIIRHFDASGKLCPGNWRGNNWSRWWEFKKRFDSNIKQNNSGSTSTDEGRLNDSDMYEVKVGDTLSGISKSVGVSVDNLIKWNDIEDPNLIFPESKLHVKSPSRPNTSNNIDRLAQEVLNGEHGNGDQRRQSLGNNFEAVQRRVNELLGSSPRSQSSNSTSQPSKTVEQLAREVINGDWGSGNERRRRLGSRYEAVQSRVNQILQGSNSSSNKSVSQLADEVMRGLHGTGRDRMRSLGNKYAKVQREVNRRLRN